VSLNGCVTKHRVPEFIRVASVGDSANDHVIQSADGAPQSESSPYCPELDSRTGEMLQWVAKAIVSISRPKFDGIMRIKLQDIPQLAFFTCRFVCFTCRAWKPSLVGIDTGGPQLRQCDHA